MMDTKQFISSSETKEQGRNEYYKMLNRVKDGELIQVRSGVYIPRHLPKGASCYRHLQTHNKTVEKFGKDSPSVFI